MGHNHAQFQDQATQLALVSLVIIFERWFERSFDADSFA